MFTTSPAKAASWLCYKNGAELTFSEYCTIKWHFSRRCALFITEVISGCKTGALTPFMSCCQMIHKLCWACNLLKCEHFSCWNVQHHSSVLNYSIPEGGNHVVTLVILIWPQKKRKKWGGKEKGQNDDTSLLQTWRKIVLYFLQTSLQIHLHFKQIKHTFFCLSHKK